MHRHLIFICKERNRTGKTTILLYPHGSPPKEIFLLCQHCYKINAKVPRRCRLCNSKKMEASSNLSKMQFIYKDNEFLGKDWKISSQDIHANTRHIARDYIVDAGQSLIPTKSFEIFFNQKTSQLERNAKNTKLECPDKPGKSVN